MISIEKVSLPLSLSLFREERESITGVRWISERRPGEAKLREFASSGFFENEDKGGRFAYHAVAMCYK